MPKIKLNLPLFPPFIGISNRMKENMLDKNRRTATTYFGYEKIDEKEKQGRVKTVFANVAENYDLMNDAMSLYVHRLWKDYFVRRINIRKDAQFIDVAGGTGDISFRILDKLRELPCGRETVTVVDINENMLEVGKVRASRLPGMERLRWICANAEKLPFEDQSFDVYTIAFGIRNCTNIDKVLVEAHRVLKPKAVFSCLEFSHVHSPIFRQIYDAYSLQVIPVLGQVFAGDFNSYKYLVESIRVFPSQEKFAQMVKDAGFREVTYEDLSCGICSIFTAIK